MQLKSIFALGLLVALSMSTKSQADPVEHRLALVLGNATYKSGVLPTAANDAGLIAQTLQAAGFDVVGARDLDADSLRHTFRDFLDKVSAAGPDTVVFVYASGYGVQYEGENYIVPVDATLGRDIDVPVEAVRLSDYIRPLSSIPARARFVVIDAGRDNTFARNGNPLASGLALVKPEPGVLIAFNSAPGTVAPEGQGPYGPYAQAVAEMIREGGLAPTELFDRVRQRVNSVTSGSFIPWSTARIDVPFVFFERAADAPPPAISRADRDRRRAGAIRELEVDDAYHEALDRDTLEAYLDFLDAYPRHHLAKRVRAIVAARREAITWRRSFEEDTPPAYWSYLDRYPAGPHAWDARRRLRHLAAELEAPASFVSIEYDVPPPPREEIVFEERRVIYFSDPYYDFAPPPPPPVYFVPPPPPDFVVLVGPAVVVDAFVLPVPVFVPVARWIEPPRYVAPPLDNVVFNNIHNATIVNNVTNVTTINNTAVSPGTVAPGPPAGAAAGPSVPPGGAPPVATAGTGPAPAGLTATQIGAGVVATGVAAAALKVALPPAVAKKAALLPPAPGAAPASPNVAAPLLAPNGRPLRQLPQKLTPSPGPTPTAAPSRAPSALPLPGPPKAVSPTTAQGPAPPGAAPLSQPNPAATPAPGPAQTTSGPPAAPPAASTNAPPKPASVAQPSPAAPSSAGPADPKRVASPTATPTPAVPSPSQAGPVVAPAKPSAIVSTGAVSPPVKAQAQPATPPQDARKAQQAAADAQRVERQRAEEARQKAAAQQRAQEQQRQVQAQEAQRKAAQQRTDEARQKQVAAEAQHRAEQQKAQQDAQQRQRAQQAALEAQRRAEQQKVLEARQRQAQQAKQAQEAKEQKKCGVTGTPPCPQ